MKKISVLIISFLLLASFALADSDDASYLATKTDRISCTLDFHTAVISDLSSKISQASGLSTWLTTLNNDKAKLQSLASAGNQTNFKAFVQVALRNDLKSADEAVRDVRKNFKEYNVTKEVRTSLRDSFKADQTNFADCVKQNDLKVAQHKVDYYTKALDKRQDQVNKLAARNISTAEMSSIISQARVAIVTPLQNAANSGDASQAQAAFKQYCLWSGCINGTNFHFAAKFEQARLSALLAKVTPMANAAGLSGDVSIVQTEIDASKTALNSVGTASYGEGDKEPIWAHLKSATEDFKKLLKDLRNAIKV